MEWQGNAPIREKQTPRRASQAERAVAAVARARGERPEPEARQAKGAPNTGGS